MQLEDIKEETLSQLINRHELIEPLPIKHYRLLAERLSEGIYELLQEINFGEPHPLEIVTPSWWSCPSISINTVGGFTKLYHERDGTNEVWEPLSEPDTDPIQEYWATPYPNESTIATLEPIETQWATRYPDEPNIPRAWRK